MNGARKRTGLPKHTLRLASVNAGSPTSREGAPRRTMLHPWHNQEELEERSWVNSLPRVERQQEQEHAANAMIERRRVLQGIARPA